jgi:hypothetical protein
MNVSYVAPLTRAWQRAERMLFKPFQFPTWLVLGFAAFLSEFFTGNKGFRFASHGDHGLSGLSGVPGRVLATVSSFLLHPVWTLFVICLVILGLIIAVVILWVSCRGRFIFLDNVAHERIGIVEPWARFARPGNSLFVWSLLFGLICLGVALVIALPFLASLVAAFSGDGFLLAKLASLGMLISIASVLGVVVAYTLLFLSDFVIPIMYRHDLGILAAWGRFLSLFQAHPSKFLLYGLFVLVLHIAIGIVVATLGLMSCCVGLVILAIPYVGQVILLPILVTLRALGPEFLAQFGPDLVVLADAPAPVSATPGPGGPVPPAGGAGA